jgi:hypothetical protein
MQRLKNVDTALNSSNVLANKNVFVGDINGEAAVALSGDVAITNAGVVTIETDANDSKDFRRYDSSR